MPHIATGITGLNEILGRHYGIEELYWEPFIMFTLQDRIYCTTWPNVSSTENLQKRDTFFTVYSKKLKITHKKNVSIKGGQSFSFLSSRSLGRSVKTQRKAQLLLALGLFCNQTRL